MSGFLSTSDQSSQPKILTVQGAAVGNAVSITFLHHVRILNAYFLLTTTATVGNRIVRIHLDDIAGGSGIVFIQSSNLSQAASSTRRYNFFNGVQRDTAFYSNTANQPLPDKLHMRPDQQFTFDDAGSIDPLDAHEYSINYEIIG